MDSCPYFVALALGEKRSTQKEPTVSRLISDGIAANRNSRHAHGRHPTRCWHCKTGNLRCDDPA